MNNDKLWLGLEKKLKTNKIFAKFLEKLILINNFD